MNKTEYSTDMQSIVQPKIEYQNIMVYWEVNTWQLEACYLGYCEWETCRDFEKQGGDYVYVRRLYHTIPFFGSDFYSNSKKLLLWINVSVNWNNAKKKKTDPKIGSCEPALTQIVASACKNGDRIYENRGHLIVNHKTLALKKSLNIRNTEITDQLLYSVAL